METKKSLKVAIIEQIKVKLNLKIEEAKQAINSAKESRDNETKSSVGDKYETSRAMMQYELEKNKIQLNRTLKLRKEILSIDCEKEYDKVNFGSLVVTNQGNYFISVALGKIKINDEEYFCLSLASPIGKILKGKIENDKFLFKGNEIKIVEIL